MKPLAPVTRTEAPPKVELGSILTDTAWKGRYRAERRPVTRFSSRPTSICGSSIELPSVTALACLSVPTSIHLPGITIRTNLRKT